MASPMKAETSSSSSNVTSGQQVALPSRRYNLRGQEQQEAQMDKQRQQLMAKPIVKLTRIKLVPVHPDGLGPKGKLQLKSNLQVVIRRCDDRMTPGGAAVALQSSSSSTAQPNKPMKVYKRKWKSAPDTKQTTAIVQQQQAMAKKLKMRVILPPLRVREVLGKEGHGGARARRLQMVTHRQKKIDTTQDENNNDVTVTGDGDGDTDMTGSGSHVDLDNNLAETISISITTSGYSPEISELDLEKLQISSSHEHQIVPFGCSDELKDYPDDFAEADEIIEAELKKLHLNPCTCVQDSESKESTDEFDAFLDEMISFANLRELPCPPGAQANVLKYEKILGNISYDQIRAIPIDGRFWQLVLQGEEGDMSTVQSFEKDVAMHFFQSPELRWSSNQ